VNEWSPGIIAIGEASHSRLCMATRRLACLPPGKGLRVKVQLWENNRTALQGRSRSIGPRQRGGLIVGTMLLSRQSSFQCMVREA
jgi:hypothetical protein